MEKTNTGKNFIITPESVFREVKPQNNEDFSLEEVQAIVGGYVEIVRLENPKLIMLVNEEGLIHGLSNNVHASVMAQRLIVGTVLVCESRRFK